MTDVTPILVGEGPAEIEAATRGGELAEPLECASLERLTDVIAAAGTPLVWVLHRAARPDEETLPRLLDDATQPGVSVPVAPTGTPLDRLLGRFTEWDLEGVLAAAARKRVPLRHTHLVSLLVETGVARGVAPPQVARYGRYAAVEWTARLFAAKRGMLVPASRVVIDPGAVPGSLADALRTARAGIWHRGETLRELAYSVTRG